MVMDWAWEYDGGRYEQEWAYDAARQFSPPVPGQPEVGINLDDFKELKVAIEDITKDLISAGLIGVSDDEVGEFMAGEASMWVQAKLALNFIGWRLGAGAVNSLWNSVLRVWPFVRRGVRTPTRGEPSSELEDIRLISIEVLKRGGQAAVAERAFAAGKAIAEFLGVPISEAETALLIAKMLLNGSLVMPTSIEIDGTDLTDDEEALLRSALLEIADEQYPARYMEDAHIGAFSQQLEQARFEMPEQVVPENEPFGPPVKEVEAIYAEVLSYIEQKKRRLV